MTNITISHAAHSACEQRYMRSPARDRKELEELWLQRLENAKLRLDFAQNYKKEVAQDFPFKEVLNSDGHFAYQQAIQAENSALREYNRVRRIYFDLTMNGIIPDESAWPPANAPGEIDGE